MTPLRSILKTLDLALTLALFVTMAGLGQGNQPVKSWQVAATGIASDPLGFFYLFSNRSVIKFNPYGDSIYSWSEPALGSIGHLSVEDPLRLLVYLPDFNKIRYLDKTLSPVGDPIDLDEMGFQGSNVVCSSSLGGCWIYNIQSQKLFRMDGSGAIQVSGTLVPMGSHTSGRISMRESSNEVVLHIADYETLTFDLFGNFIRKKPESHSFYQHWKTQRILINENRIFLQTKPAETGIEILLPEINDKALEACINESHVMLRFAEWVGFFNRKDF